MKKKTPKPTKLAAVAHVSSVVRSGALRSDSKRVGVSWRVSCNGDGYIGSVWSPTGTRHGNVNTKENVGRVGQRQVRRWRRRLTKATRRAALFIASLFVSVNTALRCAQDATA